MLHRHNWVFLTYGYEPGKTERCPRCHYPFGDRGYDYTDDRCTNEFHYRESRYICSKCQKGKVVNVLVIYD